jgi:hypothetical protein
MPGTPNGSPQASRENSFQMKLKRPTGSLNEKTMTTAIGTRRYANAAIAYAVSAWWRIAERLIP